MKRKMLKVLSILQIIIGILCVVVGAATLILGNFMDDLAKLPAEQQTIIAMKVSAILGLISGVFNFCCGWYGLKGEKGIKKACPWR